MAMEEAAPLEETIEALMDYLVDPLLPRTRTTPITPEKEQAVARQMHAVVLLTNYFQRRYKSDLETLDFEKFCKMAIIAKKGILAFMSDLPPVSPVKLSITEKQIMEAFDVCNGLSHLKNVLYDESCRVSEVSVLLVDSTKKNCLLQFNNTTNGVWSLIRRRMLDSANKPSRGPPAGFEKVRLNPRKLFCGTRALKETSEFIKFDEVAFSSIKEEAGIDSCDLVVLGKHLVYSLTAKESTVRLYIMQCLKQIDEKIEQISKGKVNLVPIEEIVNSVEKPMVAKVSGNWEATPAVPFFTLIPYWGLITENLAMEQIPWESNTNQGRNLSRIRDSYCGGLPKNFTESDLPRNLPEHDTFSRKRTSTTFQPTGSTDEVTKICKTLANLSKHSPLAVPELSVLEKSTFKSKQTDSPSPAIGPNDEIFNTCKPDICMTPENAGESSLLVSQRVPLREMDSTFEVQNITSHEHNSVKQKEDGLTPRDRAENTVCPRGNISDLDTTKGTSFFDRISASRESSRISKPSSGSGLLNTSTFHLPNVSQSPENLEQLRENTFPIKLEFQNSVCYLTIGTSNALDGTSIVRGSSHPQESSDVSTLHGRHMDCVPKPELKPHLSSSLVKMVNDDFVKGSIDSSVESQGSREAAQGSPLDVEIYKDSTVAVSTSDLWKESKALYTLFEALQHRYESLNHQQIDLGDYIAKFDKKLEEILEGRKDASLSTKDTLVDHLIPHFENSMEEPVAEFVKRRRLSEDDLISSNLCEKLDKICLRNNWLLPNYNIVPSKGGYEATVTISGVKIQCSAGWGLQLDWQKAMESAASEMLKKVGILETGA